MPSMPGGFLGRKLNKMLCKSPEVTGGKNFDDTVLVIALGASPAKV